MALAIRKQQASVARLSARLDLVSARSQSMRAYWRRTNGHRVYPFKKGGHNIYLPRRVHTALMKRLQRVDARGGYTYSYEYLTKVLGLQVPELKKGK